MDIRVDVIPTLDEYYHFHMLSAGRTGAYKYLSLLPLVLFFILVLMLMALSALNGIFMENIFFFAILVVMPMMVFFLNYIYVPRKINALSRQFMDLSGEQEYRFTDGGVAYKDQHRESNIPWEKYVKWMEDDRILVLFQTDNMANLIPKRCLSPEQMAEIRRAIADAKIPVRKIRHVATWLFLSITLFGALALGCFLAVWFFRLTLDILSGS